MVSTVTDDALSGDSQREQLQEELEEYQKKHLAESLAASKTIKSLEDTVAALQQDVQSARAASGDAGVVAELKERIAEMEVDLQRKAEQVEEADDKLLE